MRVLFWLFRVPVGLRVWPGQAFSSFLFFFSCHFSLPVRLARLKCLCLPPSVVVVVVPCCRSPAGWFVPSRAPDATQCVVFIRHVVWSCYHFIGLGNSSRMLGSNRCVCVHVRVRSRLPCFGFIFGILGLWPALSEFGRGGSSTSSLSLSCCCVFLLLLMRWSACNYLMSG